MLRITNLFMLCALIGIPGMSSDLAAQVKLKKYKGHMEAAVTAVFGHRPAKNLKVGWTNLKDTFHIYPGKVVVRDKLVTMKGRISHVLKWRPDDQIYYKITKNDGVITSIQTKYNRGGFSKLVRKYGKFVYPFIDNRVPLLNRKNIVAALRKLGKIDSSWEGMVGSILSRVAIRMNEKGRDTLNVRQSTVRPRGEGRGGRSSRRGEGQSGERKARRRDRRGKKN